VLVLSDLPQSKLYPFLPLDYPPQKEKALSRDLPPLMVLCTLYWAFCLLYLSSETAAIQRTIPFKIARKN